MNKFAAIIIALAAVGLSVLLLATSSSCLSKANEDGKTLGADTGLLVGAAVGSFDGFTGGWSEGAEAGKEAGISAADTTAELGSDMRMIGKLKILEMDVTLTDEFSKNEYAALIVWQGTASYTVDLEQCAVTAEGDRVKISVPRPVLSVYIDTETPKKVAEWSSIGPQNGSLVDGYKGYVNSLKMTEEKVRGSLIGYDSLRQLANDTARETVERLAGSVMLNGKTVSVELVGDEKIELSSGG